MVRKKIFMSYWEETSNIKLIKLLIKYPEFKNKIFKLLKNESIFFSIIKINTTEITLLREAIKGKNVTFNSIITDLIFSYLFHNGYLTISGDNYCIPNKEIYFEIDKLMIKYCVELYRINRDSFREICESIRNILASYKSGDKIEKFQVFRNFLKLFL